MSSSQHVYEIRPRKDRRGLDLISERLPLGVLSFEGRDAIEDAANYARSFSYSHPVIIRVFDESGTFAVTLESTDDCSRAVNISARLARHLFSIEGRCRYCNRTFTLESHNQKYCSYVCRANAKLKEAKPSNQEVERCSYCDGAFMPASHNQKYCSYACRAKAKLEERSSLPMS